MRLHIALALLSIAATACQDDRPASPTTFAEDSLSLVPPDGWRAKHEKDTLVFVGGTADEKDQSVIAIRAVPIEVRGETRSVDTALASVRTVLAGLPAARVKGPTTYAHASYPALAFDVVFTPKSKGGRRYQRRHVVLEAHQHIFHAFLTAPEGELTRSLPAFEKVLASLREEV
jgi:hypothetical protein